MCLGFGDRGFDAVWGAFPEWVVNVPVVLLHSNVVNLLAVAQRAAVCVLTHIIVSITFQIV